MQKLLSRVTNPEEREKGFTLIELLVVIIIIGILAAIAIPIFLNQKHKATGASVKSDVRNAVSVVESALTDDPNASVAGASTSPGSAFALPDGSEINVSSGNMVKIAGSGADGYCILAQNPDGSPEGVVYDSTTGQLTTVDYDGNLANVDSGATSGACKGAKFA